MKRQVCALLCIVCVSFLGQLSVPSGAGATAGDMWASGEISSAFRSAVAAPFSESYPCDGTYGAILIDRYGTTENACVYGSAGQVRVARYTDQGTYRYVVSFPTSSVFYELRGVCVVPRCVYSSQSDTIVMHYSLPNWRYGARVYKNFSQHLVRHADSTTQATYFSFEAPLKADFILRMGNYEPSVEAITLSNNGKWALFEMKIFGVALLNVDTLEVKRIIAPGIEYGLLNDPLQEMAVSDDGRVVAIAGWRMNLSFKRITKQCGDALHQHTEKYFESRVIPCEDISIDSGVFKPQFQYAIQPRFSYDGSRLSLVMRYSNGAAEHVLLTTERVTVPPLAYLALGDSFTSGDGELNDTYYRSHPQKSIFQCHNSYRSYPFLIGAVWNKSTQNVACSGARTSDILGSEGYSGQRKQALDIPEHLQAEVSLQALTEYTPGVVPQITFAARYQPEILSLGIGGNDAGLVGKLTACLAPGMCEWVNNPVKRYSTALEIKRSYDKVRTVLREIKRQSPASKVLVVGYPFIIDTLYSHCDLVLSSLLHPDERRFINESIHYLNQVLKAAADAEKVRFADIETAFGRNVLCGTVAPSAVNSVRVGDDVAPIKALKEFTLFGSESFHPTPFGHRLMSDRILSLYPQSDTVSCDDCENREFASPPPSSYWYTPGVALIHQYEAPYLTDTILKIGNLFNIVTPKHLFAPLSSVKVELHSQAVFLTEGVSQSDGSISFAALKVPEVEAGYHVLHLLGTNQTGEEIDVYQTVAIEEVSVPVSESNAFQQINIARSVSHEDDKKFKEISSEPIRKVLGVTVFKPSANYDDSDTEYVENALGIGWILGVSGIICMLGFLYLYIKYRRNHPDRGG